MFSNDIVLKQFHCWTEPALALQLANMTEQKKNIVGALIFMLFVVTLPVATIVFSKIGLDRYKDIRSEMRYLKDSIRVDFDALNAPDGATLNNGYLKGKLVMTGFYDIDCKGANTTLIQGMKGIQARLEEKDREKILFVIPLNGATLSDSLLTQYRTEWAMDSSQWKWVTNGTPERYKMDPAASCTTVSLLDGRVSRKDKTDNYLSGPLLGDYYDLQNQEDEEALLRHMAVLMPEKKRKSIEYRAEQKLYHSNKDSILNE